MQINRIHETRCIEIKIENQKKTKVKRKSSTLRISWFGKENWRCKPIPCQIAGWKIKKGLSEKQVSRILKKDEVKRIKKK